MLYRLKAGTELHPPLLEKVAWKQKKCRQASRNKAWPWVESSRVLGNSYKSKELSLANNLKSLRTDSSTKECSPASPSF
jgi:hypothetical protein